jgi:hypothetical protein
MKKLLLFSLLFIPVFFLSGCAGKQGIGDTNPAPAEGAGTTVETAGTTTVETAGATSMTVVNKDKFSLQVPVDWIEDPTLFVSWDTSSAGTASWGDKADKADGDEYQTRLSVSYQYLGSQTFASRMEEVQEKIKTLYPDAQFSDRVPLNGHPGRVFEGGYKIDKVSYRVFVFLLAGKDVADSGKIRDAYMVSFQTRWTGDAISKLDDFYKIVDSFEMK